MRSTPPSSLSSWRIRLPRFTWLHTFILLQFLLQIALLFPGISQFRFFLRVGTFALSLGLLWKIPKTGIKHPAKLWALVVLCIMALQLFWNPYISTSTAGVAQCLLYLAILAPLFWVSRLEIRDRDFRWLIYIIWGFHSVSSIIGVLQVYYPDLFNFTVSSVITESVFGGENLKITLANGVSIYRPSGLSDAPGGAASSGFYALLFGIGIALQERNLLLRLAGIAIVPIGLFCIYLSQVRSILILSLVSLLMIALILIQLRRFWQVIVMAGATTALATFTTRWAVNVGGEVTSDRFLSLLADSPDKVVYSNRGHFLEYTITDLLPQFPLGAGLGRWGMMNGYFGDNTNPITPPLWAEIQWTGWLLDGGIPLVIAYSGAILATCFCIWQVACNRQSSLQLWGAIILAYNVGAIVITFNYPVFISQGGMEFWTINTALFVAARYCHRHQVISYGQEDEVVSVSDR